MKRRDFLAAAGTAAAASSFPAPAIAQGIRELKLVLSWPSDPTSDLLARLISNATGGRIKVKVFGAGELVGGFEVFDAVSEGLAEMYWSADYYWQDRSPAFNFFTTVPYGLNSPETYAWIFEGGGQELWDELSANFNIKPLLAGASGVQMGGWYNREMTSIEDFKGLRMRMPGLGGEVMRRLGAIVVNLPAPDIVPAMRSGALDAAEWIGPLQDFSFGLHTVGQYYYYPGFHEPATALCLGVNRKLWNSLSGEEQELIETASTAFCTVYRAYTHGQHSDLLPNLLKEHGVQLRKFDDAILRAFGKASGEVVAEVGHSDPLTRRVYDSYMKFYQASRMWSDVSERAYLNARALDFPYGT